MSGRAKHRPSTQVTRGSFGIRATLHLLTPAGWARLVSSHRDGDAVEARMGELTVASADACGGGVTRPADGVVALRVGATLGTRAVSHPLAHVVVFSPADLTGGARAEVDALLARHRGAAAAARVDNDAVRWGQVSGALEDFDVAPAPAADRVVAAALDHDAATTKMLGAVTVGIPLLDRVADETGVAPTYDQERETYTLVHRGVALCAPVELGRLGRSSDRVEITAGRALTGEIEHRSGHVLPGDYPEDVAEAYAKLRRDGLDPHEALTTAEALQG